MMTHINYPALRAPLLKKEGELVSCGTYVPHYSLTTNY